MSEEQELGVSKLEIALVMRRLFMAARLMEHPWSRVLTGVFILGAALLCLSVLAASHLPENLPPLPTSSAAKAMAILGFLRSRRKRASGALPPHADASREGTGSGGVPVTLWHNLHPDRQLGWQSGHPMAPVFTFTLPARPLRNGRDTRGDLDDVLTRFAFTADPGADDDLRRYQRSGLRPLDVGDVIGIADRLPGQGARTAADGQRWDDSGFSYSRWHLSPTGWHPVPGLLAAHLAENDTFLPTPPYDAYDLIASAVAPWKMPSQYP
ncbi:hypothetical protein [Nonomuraea ceibae]|uniref:hypothetical protein n=1 Tax=Nonomuraea ceibae TaxID=1935170 RepID=UPI001C5EF934|nr:hypothetical protein [Nonomuraea ceibae]